MKTFSADLLRLRKPTIYSSVARRKHVEHRGVKAVVAETRLVLWLILRQPSLIQWRTRQDQRVDAVGAASTCCYTF